MILNKSLNDLISEKAMTDLIIQYRTFCGTCRIKKHFEITQSFFQIMNRNLEISHSVQCS